MIHNEDILFLEDETIEDIEKIDKLKITTQVFNDFGLALTLLKNVNYEGNVDNEIDVSNEVDGVDIQEHNVEDDVELVQELRRSDRPRRLPTKLTMSHRVLTR
jgi:hypothetical protein